MLIIFDLDDTLVDTSGSIIPYKLNESLQIMVEHGLVVEDFQQALAMLKTIDARSESSLDALKEFLEIHDCLDSKLLALIAKRMYTSDTFQYDVFPTQFAIETLMELSKKHLLAVVSAGIEHVQLGKMKKAGIDTSIFSRIVVCEEGGKKKYYTQIVEELKISPLEVIVCGDRIKRDLTPAKALGFKTVHMKWGRGLYQKGDRQDIDFTIRSLDQLKSIMVQFEYQ